MMSLGAAVVKTYWKEAMAMTGCTGAQALTGSRGVPGLTC